MTDSQIPTVLVVDDEEAYVDAYATWLAEYYDVRTATDGFAALEALDRSVDVVLLDRRMPRLSGDDVLEEIRKRGFNCRVAMITAVEPAVDIVDMNFDEYLVKPATREEILATVEDLLRRSKLDADLRECFALVSKKVMLETTMGPTRLSGSDEYRTLLSQIEETERSADARLSELIETGNVASVYHDIES